MQNMEQANSEIRGLTDAEISAGNIFGDVGRWIVRRLQGNGDQRRPLDQP
jgi:hypothetical protein